MEYLSALYLYLIYPVYTLWFALHASLVHENLSYVGNLEGMRIYFILWAFSCVTALAIGFHKCLKKSVHKKILITAVITAALLFLLSVILPYLPENYPILADFHITLSFTALYLLLIVIVLLVVSLRFYQPIHPYPLVLGGIYGIAFVIFALHYMSVNSLAEIFLGITLPIYLYRLGGAL